MKLEINDDDMRIIPEDPLDLAYLTHVLGLNEPGAQCCAKRSDPPPVVVGYGESGMNYLLLTKEQS